MFADAQSDKQSIDTAAIMTSVYISMDAALKLTAFLHKEMLQDFNFLFDYCVKAINKHIMIRNGKYGSGAGVIWEAL